MPLQKVVRPPAPRGLGKPESPLLPLVPLFPLFVRTNQSPGRPQMPESRAADSDPRDPRDPRFPVFRTPKVKLFELKRRHGTVSSTLMRVAVLLCRADAHRPHHAPHRRHQNHYSNHATGRTMPRPEPGLEGRTSDDGRVENMSVLRVPPPTHPLADHRPPTAPTLPALPSLHPLRAMFFHEYQ